MYDKRGYQGVLHLCTDPIKGNLICSSLLNNIKCGLLHLSEIPIIMLHYKGGECKDI